MTITSCQRRFAAIVIINCEEPYPPSYLCFSPTFPSRWHNELAFLDFGWRVGHPLHTKSEAALAIVQLESPINQAHTHIMPRYARVASNDRSPGSMEWDIVPPFRSSLQISFFSSLLMCSSVFLKHLTVSNTNVTQFSVSVRFKLVSGSITLANKCLHYGEKWLSNSLTTVLRYKNI